MKTKNLSFLGFFAFVVISAVLVVSGCDDGNTPVDVENWPSTFDPPDVGTVTLTATTGNAKKFILSWDAVDDAGGYSVYLRQEGKKTYSSLDSVVGISYISRPTSGYPVVAADGSQATTGTYDLDKWFASFDTTSFQAAPVTEIPTGTVFEVGVGAGSGTPSWAATKITKAAP